MLQIFRKQIVFLILFMAFTFLGFAQKSGNGNTVKLFTGSKWFNKFSVGISGGVLKSSVLAGGSNDFTKNKLNFGYGLNIKYQFTHYLALQVDLVRGKLSGDQTKVQGNDSLNTYKPVTSFRTNLHIGGSISAIYTFSNINWLNLKNWFVPYVGVGGGLANYDVKFTPIGSTERYYPYGLKNDITELYVPISMGVRFKLTKMINLDLGYTMNFMDGDNLDGFAYWRVPPGYSSITHKDKFSYAHAGVEISLGKKSKDQLLFDNPVARLNNNLQTQIDNLTTKVDSLAAKQKGMDDTDGDSVADLFDKEPNTPAGCPVDAQGVMRDTDGDGVVDCKDKQLITPTECQPVDADGVGKCPDPACCKGRTGNDDGNDSTLNANCPSDYPGVTFRGNSIRLSADMQATIATIAAKMKARPDCKIVIKGYPATSKSSQAICQKRVDAIKLQLKEREGISADRITTNCEVGGGDKNAIEIISN
ncbi:MAG: hypothetical protein ABI741_05430 [Ferruginibacter sp.]